jgi:membrane-associated phospholipid phosphatase
MNIGRFGKQVGSRISWSERVVAAIFVYLLCLGGYGLVNRHVAIAACMDLSLSLDARIPFISAFVYPFYLTYVLVLIPALMVSKRALLRYAVVVFSILVVVSCLIFLMFPTYVPRPAFQSITLSDHLVAIIYKNDRPSCAFPSLHVSSAMLTALVMRRDQGRYGWFLWPSVIAVSASTVFIKQHVVIDVVGGILLAMAIEWVMYRLVTQQTPRQWFRHLS